MTVQEQINLAQVLVQFSVPVLIGVLGWILNSRLKSIDQAQWQNRKIIELRLDVYKEVSPKFNAIYCYCMYIGDWKNHSPDDIVQMKRQLDKTMHVYRHLLSAELFTAYEHFIATTFEMFTGTDRDARIRTAMAGDGGNRPATYRGTWKAEWERFFAPQAPASRDEVRASYEALMEAFRACIGLRPL